MPILVLKPYYEIPISKQQEDIILQFLESSEIAITVNNATITKGAIAYIKPGGYTQADLPQPSVDPGRRLKADNRTTAEQEQAANKKATEIREIIKTKGLKGLKKQTVKGKL